MQKQTLCLNMIVKDESHIIRDTLTKLCNKVKFDYWVISDTGSTDNTKEIIKNFFKEKNINGEIFDDKWENFAHNRSKALEHAYNKTDYLMIFDADDEICGDIVIPSPMTVDSYYFKFGTGGTEYERIQMVNNRKRWKYLSVIHEFITCLEPPETSATLQGDYHIVSGKVGNRSKNPDKYLDDARILKNEYRKVLKIKDNPEQYNLHLRYAFYCANSYKDAGKPKKAIKWYKTVLKQDNWYQEKYYSCIRLYDCYKEIGEEETGFFYLVKGLNIDPDRVECIYPLILHYWATGDYNIAYNYYKIVQNFMENRYFKYPDILNKKLFVDIGKYDFYVPNYMILVADKLQEYQTVIKMFNVIFVKKYKITDPQMVSNLLFNLQFFIKHIKVEEKEEFITNASNYIKFIHVNKLCQLDKYDFLKKYIEHGIKVDYIFPDVVINKEAYFTREECEKSQNILFYTGFSNENWNYTYSLSNALGGSEKAVMYMATELSKIKTNYKIYISGGVKNEQINNIEFINLNDLNKLIQQIPFHTVIVSRYVSFYEMFPKTSYYQSYIWAHDTHLLPYGCNLQSEQIIKKWNKYIDGCICLTEWHKEEYLKIYPEFKDKLFIINNGINPELFKKHIKKANRFIYTSCSERGLHILLDLWPKMTDKLANAELVIASYNKFPKDDFEKELQNIINKYDNIHHLGQLGTEDLYREIAQSEYWLYPCVFPETSCITSLEMLMSEVICIYYPIAGLTYTLGDYGVQVKSGTEIDTLLSLTKDKKRKLKIQGKEYAKSCSWYNKAKCWSNLFFDKKKYELEEYLYMLYRDYGIPEDHKNYLNKLSTEFVPKVIYDIGSSTLHWTREGQKTWPNSKIILFDAIDTVEFLYNRFNYEYYIGVISDIDNRIVKFYNNDKWPGGNSYYKEIGGGTPDYFFPEDGYTEMKTKTLYSIVQERNFPLPDLVKIDVQGAELDILRGGIEIINHAKYLIIELQHQQYNRGAPLADVTIKFLEENGWKIKDAKFCDNGPDADYCFIKST